MFFNNLAIHFELNKTGLQPVSRPVEQTLGFLWKGIKNYQKGIIIRENGAKVEEKCV